MTASSPANLQPHGHRIRWLILSLLLGAAVAALIARAEKKDLELAIAVTFDGLTEELLLAGPTRPSVRLLVSGNAFSRKAIDPGEASCRLDLSGLGEGTHTVLVNQSNIELPDGVVLRELLTPSLQVRLEKASSKTVDVIAVLQGSPAPGFAVAAVTLKPDRIVLKGPEAMLVGIDTVKTRPIDLEAASEPFKKEVPLNLPSSVAVVPPLRIAVAQVEIDERIITRVLENIPVLGKGNSAGHRIHPAALTLTVSGPEAIVNAIETDPAFAVTIDLAGLPPGTHLLKAAINLPLRTTLVRVSPERFSVSITR
jgi:YbbR domain-containing protein